VVRPRKISDFKPLFSKLAQTSHFIVEFGISQNRELTTYLTKRGVDPRFVSESAGLLVRDASLPTTSFATTEAYDYLGVTEKFAHTRQFTEMSMEIYVDRDYRTIKFFEHWMEFIASGSHNQELVANADKKPEIKQSRKNYITRYQYPNYYKSDSTRIIKFERDYNVTKELQYNFLGLFPSAMSSISVSYQDSNIMTLGVTFTYDRYVPGAISSLAESTQNDNNKQSEYAGAFSKKITNLSTDQITDLYRNSDKYTFARDTSIDTSNIEWPKTFNDAKNVQASFRAL